MGCGTQNIIHNLFHEQLKCTYVHAKRKIELQNFVTDPKIMKSHSLLTHKTYQEYGMYLIHDKTVNKYGHVAMCTELQSEEEITKFACFVNSCSYVIDRNTG